MTSGGAGAADSGAAMAWRGPDPAAPTQPLTRPAGSSGGPYGFADPAGQPGRPRRRLVTVLRRAAVSIMALGLAAVVAFGVLLLVTPSAGNARQLASAFDRAHGAPYPGVVVPHRLAAALEATEDHRFATEPGVDPIAVLRVGLGYVTGRVDQGGATLYQQLAKMLYTPGRSSIGAELEQIALAVKLKFHYSGPEVLRLYADVAYFGHGFYGLSEASCGYFGVRPAAMSWPQAALLAGLVQGPSADDPLAYPAAGRAREVHVMERLVAVGALSQPSANQYLRIPMSALLAHAGACQG